MSSIEKFLAQRAAMMGRPCFLVESWVVQGAETVTVLLYDVEPIEVPGMAERMKQQRLSAYVGDRPVSDAIVATEWVE